QVLAESQSVSRAAATARPAPELTIVVPTFNERANIPLLVGRLRHTLEGIDWEVLFVDDDSPDRTAAAVRALGEQDARVRCLRRAAAEEIAPSLSSQGFKILLDLVATSRGSLRIAELPYIFRERQHGESKLDARIVLDFFALIVAKLSNDAVSFRFLMFCFVGLTGVFIHMAALVVALDLGGLTFGPAQTTATVIAIAWNFTLN